LVTIFGGFQCFFAIFCHTFSRFSNKLYSLGIGSISTGLFFSLVGLQDHNSFINLQKMQKGVTGTISE